MQVVAVTTSINMYIVVDDPLQLLANVFINEYRASCFVLELSLCYKVDHLYMLETIRR